MSEPTPAGIEQAAAEDVRRADESLAALEQRVLDDDQDVTPAEIETARSARHFAGLRQKAAQRKAAKLRQQEADAEAQRRLDAFRAEIPDDPAARVAELRAKATAALVELETYARDYNDVIRRHIGALRTAGRDSSLDIKASHPGDSVLAWYVQVDGRMYQMLPRKSETDRAVADARQLVFEADRRAV
ncbi:hypothetical protein [Streptomyces sp. NPDC003730]